MLSIGELLDLAKKVQKIESDYRLAQLLGTSQSGVINYRAGRSLPQNPIAARLGGLCGLDPDAVVCWVNLERAATEAERETWLSILHRVEHSPRSELAA